MVGSLYRYRSFIWQHAVADLRHRYAGSGMGAVWNILHPLSLIAVYAIIFTRFVGREVPGIPGPLGYTVQMCAGFFPWLGFTECITRGASAFSSNAPYLKKLPIPEQVFVAQTAASATFTMIIGFVLLATIALACGVRPTWYWVLLPVPMVLMQATGFGIGLICGTLAVFFTDIVQLIGIVLNLLFWVTPIIYLRQSQGPALQRIMVWLPGTPGIEAVRNLFLYHRLPETWSILALLGWALGTIGVGWWVLSRLRAEIRDVI